MSSIAADGARAEASTVRSFINLRAFAAREGEHGRPSGGGRDAFFRSRVLLPLAEGPVTAGVVLLAAGQGEVASMPADEFVIVHEGQVRLESDGKAWTLEAGASMVLVRGVSFTWTTQAPATLIFLRRTGGASGEAALVPIDEQAPLEPSGAPLAELLVGPTPRCRNHGDYRSGDGEFVCGTWDSTPYHRRAMTYRHFELMHLLAGSVTFVDGAGAEATFGAGDIFLIEQDAHCSWESREHVKKVYAIYRPA